MNNMMQGMQLLKMVSDMNKRNSAPGAMGTPQTPTGLPDGMPDFLKNGVIGKLMSSNPGGLLGALRGGGNDPVNPGAPPPAGSPDYVPGGQGPMAGGAPAGGGMTLGQILPNVGMLGNGGPGGATPPAPLSANSSADDIWNSYKSAGGGADLSNNQFVKNSQNFGTPMFNMQQGVGGGLNALRSFFGGGG